MKQQIPKRLFSVALVLSLNLFLLPHPAEAGMFDKLGRGIQNVFTSPLELFAQPVRKGSIDEKPGVAFVSGLLRGATWMVFRATSGVYDIVTFPIPIPYHYGSIMQPETVFGELEASRQHHWSYPKSDIGRQPPDEDRPLLSYPNPI
jgi:putative exosortase-associated protein (TIGR04073 family)